MPPTAVLYGTLQEGEGIRPRKNWFGILQCIKTRVLSYIFTLNRVLLPFCSNSTVRPHKNVVGMHALKSVITTTHGEARGGVCRREFPGGVQGHLLHSFSIKAVY